MRLPKLKIEEDEILDVPMSVVVNRATGAEAKPNGRSKRTGSSRSKRKRAERRPKKTSSARWLILGLILISTTCGILAIILGGLHKNRPDTVWKQALQLYGDKRWGGAVEAFEKFCAEHETDDRCERATYYICMGEIQREILSSTPDPVAAVEKLDNTLKSIQENSLYSENRSAVRDVTEVIVSAFVDQNKLEEAEAALKFVRMVEVTMEASELKTVIPSLDQKISQARRGLAVKNASELVNSMLSQIASSPNPDIVYEKIRSVIDKFPELPAEDIESRISTSRNTEHSRVTYRPLNEEPTQATRTGGGVRELAVVWKDSNAEQIEQDSESMPVGDQVMALSRGVLYVFNERGQFLWFRRLGIDSNRLPIELNALSNAPQSLLASSSEDSQLLCLTAKTGEPLWSHRAGGLQGPPTVVARENVQLAFLPMGESIRVLELTTGHVLGEYYVGPYADFSGEGGFDPSSGLVFFAAHRQRVFGLDPTVVLTEEATPPCRVVLQTNHTAGSMRSRPAVVGPYVILVQDTDLSGMKLQAYRIGDDGAGRLIKEHSVSGWSWFDPVSTPDRISFVTDTGQLGLFGFNLDNEFEAFFPLFSDGKSLTIPAAGSTQNLAVYSREHLLWIMAGMKMQKYSLDIFNQKPRLVRTSSSLTGFPLHEPHVAASGKRFYVTTMADEGYRSECSAVDGDTLDIVWQRKLGLSLLTNPRVGNGRVRMLDHSGTRISLDVAKLVDPSSEITALEFKGGSGRTSRFASHRVVTTITGLEYLISVDRTMQSLRFEGFSQEAFGDPREFNIPSRLRGTPAVWQERIMAPCSNGNLLTINVEGEELFYPYTWLANPVQADKAFVTTLTDTEALLMVGNHLDMLVAVQPNQAGLKPQWKQQSTFAAIDDLIHQVAQYKNTYICYSEGDIYQLSSADLTIKRQWQVPGTLSTGFQLIDNRAVFVINDNQVLCIDLDCQSDRPDPVEIGVSTNENPGYWLSDPARGTLVNHPTVSDGVLVLTYHDSRRPRVIGLTLSDGIEAWPEVSIRVRVAASASAVLLQSKYLFMILEDGTARIVPLGDEVRTAMTMRAQ